MTQLNEKLMKVLFGKYSRYKFPLRSNNLGQAFLLGVAVKQEAAPPNGAAIFFQKKEDFFLYISTKLHYSTVEEMSLWLQ